MRTKVSGHSVPVSRAIVARHAGRIGASLGILGVCLALLAQRLSDLDPVQMHLSFMAVSPTQWTLALGAVAISYLAMGHYDVLILRHLALRQPKAQARRAGMTALAISQTVGMGLLSGSLVRWRLLPDLRFADCLRLTLAISISFLMAATVVAAVVILGFGALGAGWAIAILAAAGLCLCLCMWRPAWGSWRWPNLLTLLGMFALAAMDVTAAGVALWVLLPEADIGFATLLPAFLLALLAGMVSGTPGGLGAFELVILQQVHSLSPEALLAAVMAWRVVYFAIPSLLAIIVLAKGVSAVTQATTMSEARTPLQIDWPEAGLIHQGQLSALPIGQGRAIVVGRTGHALIGLGDVRSSDAPRLLRALKDTARSEGRLPGLYKIGRRLAVIARASGMAVTRIGAEAVIHPAHFTLDTPARAGLRRKLRKAHTAGVEVAVSGPVPPQTLDGIAQGWAMRQGGERGFSMGRFCRAYLRHQRVYLARQDGREIAFISLHVTQRIWTLDLIRHEAPLPDGTIHLLLARAIEDARLIGVDEVNLAAVPEGVFKGAHPVMRCLAKHSGAMGLWQFKASFEPDCWRPLYLAAPSAGGSLPVALGLIRAILRPGSILPPP